MSTYARIINNIAVDISTDPAAHFHPSIAAEFQLVPDNVQSGWRLMEGIWTEPAPVDPPAPVAEYPTVSPIEFKLLFTAQERVAIKAARATDPVIDDFYDVVEDPRLTFVDLGLQSTRDAIGYLAAQGLIGAERVEQILAGVMQ